MTPSYYIISRNCGTGKETIVHTLHDIGLARLFIQGTNYYIAYDEDAIAVGGYNVKAKSVMLKLSDSIEDVWHREYSMRRGEGASELVAKQHATEAAEAAKRKYS